jgi:N-acetylmuramoyl-L-alanine amidase
MSPVLKNGIVIDERFDAHNFTRAADCARVFGVPRRVTGVTIHHWGVDGQNIHDVRRYLCSDNGRSSSAHFVLQSDYVACIVNTDDAAWHAGNAVGNATTIGIECRPEMSQGDLDTLIALIQWLESIYGDLAVYTHNMWTNTACPGRYGAQLSEIVRKVNIK